jgi:hypothetical protein
MRGTKRLPFNERRTMAVRASSSFSDNDKDQVAKYLDWLCVSISKNMETIRRAGLGMLLLVAIFELVIDSKSVQVSLGSFRIYRGSIILQFIPALVAYLFLQVFIDSIKTEDQYFAFIGIFKHWSARGSDNRIDLLVLPQAPLYWNVGNQIFPDARNHDYGRQRVEGRATSAFIIFALLGFAAFQIQAYVLLFTQQSPEVILWAVSLCFTIFCLTMLLQYMASYISEPVEERTLRAANNSDS